MMHLNQLFKGIKSIKGREPSSKKPIRNYEMVKIIVFWNTNSYYHILVKTAMCVQKGFAFRVSEILSYTRTKPSIRTLTWGNIYIYKLNNLHYAQITLTTGSKTNNTHKEEILARQCICYTKYAILCPVHWLLILRNVQINHFGFINDDSFVFIRKNGNLFTTSEWNDELKLGAASIGLDVTKGDIGTHSLKHGALTDFIASGMPYWLVQRFA